MVAELLRLRLRILANGFRRPPIQIAAIVVGLLVAIVGVVLFWQGAAWVASLEDDTFAMRANTVVGSWLILAAILIPLMAVRRVVLSPRAFLGYPISPVGVGVTMLAYTLIGPGILLVPMTLASTLAWPDEESRQVAWAAAPLLFLQTLLTIQLARELGVALRRHPRIAGWIDFVSVLVLMLGGAVVLAVIAPRVPEWLDVVRAVRPLNGFLIALPDVLADTPLGMLWAAPGYASTYVRDPATAWQLVGISALIVVALLMIWLAVIAVKLKPTRRLPGPRRTRVPGWFRHFPASASGAVAARSVTYWLRDPRYRTVYEVLPFVLVITLVALWIGGVPFAWAVLVPLPLMTVLLAWSTTHNDVAYDNTAVWQHIAAQTPGADDRRGRTVPVLILGVLLLGIGIPLTVWGHGDIAIAPALTGLCVALLLGGVGVGSLYSARFPYAAPRPGDQAWETPQAATTQGVVAQGMSVLLVLLCAAPTFALAVMWWIRGGSWGWAALAVGVVSGLLVYIVGIRAGGRSFDMRGPELLAFTQRN